MARRDWRRQACPGKRERRALRQAVWNRTGGVCWYCGQQTVPATSAVAVDATFTIDHIVPRSRGGGAGNNLVASCRWCNDAKHGMTVEQFRAWLRANGHPDVFWFERQQAGGRDAPTGRAG